MMRRALRLFVQQPLKLGAWVYADNQATTPMDPRVLDSMMPYLASEFGNPHSRSHKYGWDSESAVEQARRHVADLIGAEPLSVVFTSGATESNNIAVKGIAKFWQEEGRNHIITLQTEHKCVLECCRTLEREGFVVHYLPVKQDGLVDLELLEQKITEFKSKIALVSMMFVHNEIGVIQPIAEIGRLCKKNKVIFHTDAAQAVGKIPIDVDKMGIDLLSVSGHKFYGPKGIGALYIRRKGPRVKLHSPVSGGGQERGHRSGTVPTPLVVGLGEAARVASLEMGNDHRHVSALHKRFMDGLSKIAKVRLNGSETQRYPGNLNISFVGVEGEALLMALEGCAASSGSACTSATLEPSYVLRSLGVAEEVAHTSLRFGLGRFTTAQEVDFIVNTLTQEVEKLRSVSLLWEMENEGGFDSVSWKAL